MSSEDAEKYHKSPHKPSSSSSSEPETTRPVSGSYHFPYGSSFMEDTSFSASPVMDFEAFSAFNPSNYAPPPVFQFKASPVSETVVKAEEMEEESSGVPRPLDCLQGNAIPPFLSKTFDLVDDRSLDPIISWGAKGASFVVWDPVEFSRIVLPRNFKHNNFSSFVRQLNTYGFRKVNTDRWEFANEAFRRGEKHLLRNIQRRKSPHSQQIGIYTGSSTESGRAGLESDVDKLMKDMSVMMNGVEELQQQQCGTVHLMETVNQRLQETEQKQKQMISFLGKLFKNPTFLGRLREKRQPGEIASSREKRKFLRHQQSEPDQSESSMEGQIVEYRSDWRNLTLSSAAPAASPVPVERSDYTLHGMVEMGLGIEDVPFETENAVSDDFALSDELMLSQPLGKITEQAVEGVCSSRSDDTYKGKSLMIPKQDTAPEYFISFPEDLTLQKKFLEFSSPGMEGMVKQDNEWTTGFESHAGLPSSSCELWDNIINYSSPELGPTGSFSDMWDLGSVQPADGSSFDRQLAEGKPVDETGSHSTQLKD
ncbi:hypothetical protein K2173_002097 [Erythroxylum novogranatense]|uniref:HSF-type DNA-binding domain-containing protein n=1 Tax=Erythroxylum novogranatense TaxID=1862640 RepID=A0AAV8SPJ0_9ROSI|nr:hypothetical protein K2173_002097 [Erythroxylum novogranatense]